MAQNLWPSDIAESNLITPVTILKEQATALGDLTKQIVIAEVRSSSTGSSFTHRFVLTAPAIGNYNFELLQVQYGISFYPMQLSWRGSIYTISSEQQFIQTLKDIFVDATTRNVIQSMLAQSRS
jgi:hypothetical protein